MAKKKHTVDKLYGVKVVKEVKNDPTRDTWVGTRPTIFRSKRDYNRRAMKIETRKCVREDA